MRVDRRRGGAARHHAREAREAQPAFREGGTVTAGNSSPLNDGAAALLLTSLGGARKLGLEPMARVASWGHAGVDPGVMGIGPVPASRKALTRAGIDTDTLSLAELNEAFACQVVASMRQWWWNLGARVDWSITPRPFYPADGRKIPASTRADRATRPSSSASSARSRSSTSGDRAPGSPSSRWIADAAIRHAARRSEPTLTLVYLPHLDYDFQRFGPDDPRSRAAVAEVDALVGDLLAAAKRAGAEVVVVSEYGISAVRAPGRTSTARCAGPACSPRARRRPARCSTPSPPRVRASPTTRSRTSTCGTPADRAAARSAARRRSTASSACSKATEREAAGLAHARAGDLVRVAEPRRLVHLLLLARRRRASPTSRRTVDIHRKPGYDPCELFVDPDAALSSSCASRAACCRRSSASAT